MGFVLLAQMAQGAEVMSEAYLKFWGPEVRSASTTISSATARRTARSSWKGAKAGCEVKVEQISHTFIFGGNIFLFGDLKTPEEQALWTPSVRSLTPRPCRFTGRHWSRSRASRYRRTARTNYAARHLIRW